MAWTKAERPTRRSPSASRSWPRRPMAKAHQRQGQGRPRRGRRQGQGVSVAEQLLAEFPDQGKRHRQRARGDRVPRHAGPGARQGRAGRRPRHRHRPADQHRDQPCCRARTARRSSPRGQTQALVAVTLGTADDEQRIDTHRRRGRDDASRSCCTTTSRRSRTGEVQADARHQPPRDRPRRRSPSARCSRCCPAFEEFPYTIRIVSEDPRVERLVVDGHRSAAARWR